MKKIEKILQSVLNYLHGKMGSVELHLKKNNLNVIHWWENTQYGTHLDLKGQTGAAISIRTGCVTRNPKKKKVNTTSSTISEVVGVHGALPKVLWTKELLQNQ